MSDYVDTYIKKYKPSLLKSEKYIKDNDWTLLGEIHFEKGKTINPKKEEYLVQDQSILNLLDRLKYFSRKADGYHKLPKFKNYIKHVLKVINIHINRVDNYINGVSLEDIKSTDLKKEEMEFHNLLQKKFNAVDDAIEALGIKFAEENTTNTLEFLNGMKAPLSMHKVLSEIYPEINRELEKNKIDFESDPGNELLLYMKDIPKWNPDLHYFQQPRNVLQFYVDEFKKIENGIRIDDYYISGWQYYHMNVFVTPIPQNVWNPISQRFDSEDKIMCPPLRDSDLIIFESHEEQILKRKLFLFIAATRRAAKTTIESSLLERAITIGKKQVLCAGGSTKDLGQIARNIRTSMQYKNPAFAVYNVSNDWTDKVEIGLKTKSNKTILLSTLNIINTSKGSASASQILAGYTADTFVYDEILKNHFIETLAALKPALKGKDGNIRCYGILSGTGGDDAVSADGITVLRDPEKNDVLPMNWDLLDRGVPEHLRTWEEDKNKPFGTFIPGQCCVDMPKNISTLGDYIGRADSKKLKDIPIFVTDWEKSLENIEKDREDKIGNRIEYQKQVIYIPLKPSEIFSSGRPSPFPVTEAKAHKEYLLQTGNWDRRREIFRDNTGKISFSLSTKELIQYPHKGGILDAPVLIFEDPPKDKVPYGTFIGSFDDYATDDSETNSVSTFYVIKNKILGDPFSEKIVASISFRPERHPEVHEKWLMLMEAYQLDRTTFGENFNYAIKDYLDKKHVADKYLAPSLDFTQSFNLPNNLKRKTGYTPSAPVKRHIFDLFVDYCNEEIEVETEDGEMVVLKGVQRIDDVVLLDEIISWSENANTDRIVSAAGCVAFMHYLQSSHRWKTKQYSQEQKEDRPKQQDRTKNFYGNNRPRTFYRNR